MSIFQKSVQNKYLKTQNEKKIDEMYSQFTLYFHNAEIQENIRNSKEEQFQEGFLRELFVKILGYTLNPKPNFNLTTELKNERGAKKTDGAILKNGKAIAVIELKGTDTKDLDKINEQAFNYKNNHTDCIYVITSNFEKLRFFIHNAVYHIEFNLFTLTKDDFKLLWLCLNAENLLRDVPAKLKADSKIIEENVTKKLYKDYSAFKTELWQNICENSPDKDKLLLFRKTQKLLDRFLFIFFAEDSGLLPPNSISRMVERYEQLIELDAQKPIYDIFKQYFGYINKGRKGKTAQDDIFAYNGGLFLPDEILDSLIIDDKILKPHVLEMTAYDFQSEVDVNILGHIFENSLNDIENVTAQLEGQQLNKNKTKRKKDGVFYTPKYITKYIIDNTVGILCTEKKSELGIIDEEYAKGRKNRKKATVKALNDNLQKYRNWLLEITICDPACGSGAFLIQALEFLIAEHAYIDELQANLLESSIVFQDVSNHVLENNLYGVDINEESVDIAKLSLWLRTAQRGRKLTSLNNNIKCGNSLIDNPNVAGVKAFNWQKEFPQVFSDVPKTEIQPTIPDSETDYLQLIKEKSKEAQEKAEQAKKRAEEAAQLSDEALKISKQVYEYAEKIDVLGEPTVPYGIKKGGFDVIIGNPPYVHLEKIKDTSIALKNAKYETYHSQGDIYCVFVEKGMQLLKTDGLISYIMPNKWLQAGYGKPLREYLLRYELKKLIDFGDIQIFEGATTYPCIFISKKCAPKKEISISVLNQSNSTDFEFNVTQTAELFNTSSFNGETWIISSQKEQLFLEKLKSNFTKLSGFIGGEAYRGILTGLTEAFLIDNVTKNKIIAEDAKAEKRIKPFLQGRDLAKYNTITPSSFLLLFEKGLTNSNKTEQSEAENWLKLNYPSIYNWLISFKERGKKRTDKGDYWWELRACDYYDKFAKPKIMYQTFQVKPCFIYDEQGLFCNNSMWIIPTDNKALLGVLNSKMGWWLITKYCTQIQNGYQLIWKYFGQIPIPELNSSDLTNLVEQMIDFTKKQQKASSSFAKYLCSEFSIEKLSKKLQNWFGLEFLDFIKELNKAVKKTGGAKLSKYDEMEWFEFFEEKKAQILKLQSQINQTDNEIDKVVYKLYELTPEEVNIVENSEKQN